MAHGLSSLIPMRIVSLLASGTEIVCALGAGDSLVGRSHECDNPEWVRRLPACTRPAFDVDMSSGEIDAEVRRRLKHGEPLYHVDADLVNSLAADVLITQVHCEVCAVTPSDVQRAGCVTVGDQVVALSAGSMSGIYDGVRNVARAISREREGERLVADMQTRISGVSHAAQGARKPTVVILEWTDPLFTSGNWGPELIAAAGGIPLLAEAGHHSVPVTWEHVVDADPDFLIVAPCGFNLDRTLREIDLLEQRPGWSELRAVQDNRAVFADGNKYFNRSGTTVVETTEILAEILHERARPTPWHGVAWVGLREQTKPRV
jgi:iron complex transport system substrate-binding protein